MKIPIIEKIVSAEVERRLKEIERERRTTDQIRALEERFCEDRRRTDERFLRNEKDIKTYVAAEAARIENEVRILRNAIQLIGSACVSKEKVETYFKNTEM